MVNKFQENNNKKNSEITVRLGFSFELSPKNFGFVRVHSVFGRHNI